MKQDSHIVFIIIALWRRLKGLTKLVKVVMIGIPFVVSLKVDDSTVALPLSDVIWIIRGHTEITPGEDLDLINTLHLLYHPFLCKLRLNLAVESKPMVSLWRLVDVDE